MTDWTPTIVCLELLSDEAEKLRDCQFGLDALSFHRVFEAEAKSKGLSPAWLQ